MEGDFTIKNLSKDLKEELTLDELTQKYIQ